MFPPEFEKSASVELLRALDEQPVTAVRMNPFKGAEKPVGESVPWSKYGVYLSERPVFTLDPAMHAGGYYVQEPSSQFVEYLLREETGRPVRILDLCAAPGGKTTLYSALVGPDGLVVANEPVRNRASVLADNVRRWGLGNVAVTTNDPADFGKYKHWFDVVAVDAPCSGEGMFRKNREARSQWSLANVEMCAARQRRILADVWDALRPGGLLIYSTCTFNRRENEDNVAWLAENFDVEPVHFDLPKEWNVVETSGFHFYPHLLKGEGFFVAAMRKVDGRVKCEIPKTKKRPLAELNKNEIGPLTDWVKNPDAMRFARVGDVCYAFYQPQYQAVTELAAGLNVICSGVCMGQVFGTKLRPDHALALFCELSDKHLKTTSLTREQALDYLRKREFKDVSILHEGLNLLTHNDLPIGWTKRVGHRTNSMLPGSFRIVNV